MHTLNLSLGGVYSSFMDLSLDNVVQSVNGNVSFPMRTTRYHENMAVCVLCTFLTKNEMNLVDTQVTGQHLLHPLESSSDKRLDVTVYDLSRTKVVLLVEVHSSLMWIKSIHDATDLLRLLCHKDVNFDQLTVFTLPKCGVQRDAVKTTVT